MRTIVGIVVGGNSPTPGEPCQIVIEVPAADAAQVRLGVKVAISWEEA